MNLGIVTNYTQKAAFGLANWLNPLFSTKIVIFLSVFTEIFEKFEIIVGTLIAERPDETMLVSPFCKSLKPLVSHAYLVLRLYHATVDMVKDDIQAVELSLS